MEGNPIREGPDGYFIHELDGEEYGSIWGWADALLAKYGIEYDEFVPGDMVLTTYCGKEWGGHRKETWDEFHMGLVAVCELMWQRGVPGPTESESATGSSNRTTVIRVRQAV